MGHAARARALMMRRAQQACTHELRVAKECLVAAEDKDELETIELVAVRVSAFQAVIPDINQVLQDGCVLLCDLQQ